MNGKIPEKNKVIPAAGYLRTNLLRTGTRTAFSYIEVPTYDRRGKILQQNLTPEIYRYRYVKMYAVTKIFFCVYPELELLPE